MAGLDLLVNGSMLKLRKGTFDLMNTLFTPPAHEVSQDERGDVMGKVMLFSLLAIRLEERRRMFTCSFYHSSPSVVQRGS